MLDEFREHFLELAAAFAVAGMGMLGFLLLFLRRAIVNKYDPLVVQIVLFFGPYATGYILFPALTGALTPSYWLILSLLATYLVVIRLFPVPHNAFTDVRLPPGYLRIVLVSVMVIEVLSFCVNVLGSDGGIPLFSAAGSAGRFEGTQNNRLLVWLVAGTSGTSVLIYALCQDRGVRRLAMTAFVVEAVIGFLFASKGAILQPVYLLLACMFVARARGDEVSLRRYKSMLRYGLLLLIPLIPAYLLLALRGASLGDLPLLLGVRIFGGFDQLLPAAINNMAQDPSVQRDLHLNMLQYQFLPFFKVIADINPTYSSIGQYVIEYVTGDLIEGAFTYPNSNLILETIFTSGNGLGCVFFVFELLIFYFARRWALRHPLTPASLFANKVTVFAPMSMFFSGQEFFTGLIISALFLSGCYGLWVLVRKERGHEIVVSTVVPA